WGCRRRLRSRASRAPGVVALLQGSPTSRAEEVTVPGRPGAACQYLSLRQRRRSSARLAPPVCPLTSQPTDHRLSNETWRRKISQLARRGNASAAQRIERGRDSE